MRRRGATLLAGAVMLAVLVTLAMVGIKVPYVELGPGPTWDTLGSDHGKPVIQVAGGNVPSASPASGQLRMVTVGVQGKITLWQAIEGWLDPDDAVVPREVIYPPDETQQQIDQQNQQDFQNSQSSAQTAALRELGYPVLITVDKVADDAPAAGHLASGDVITSVDGQQVTSMQKLTSLIKAKPVGTELTIGYTRDGTAGSTKIATGKASDGSPRIGVTIKQKQPSPYQITISLEDVGGPSAGMMFALGIIDKIKGVDLAGGRTIAGTGTIDDDGNVGPIGGIAQKMRGAKRDGATVFLAPADNCAEAVANAVPGLTLVKVSTLDDALRALSTLRAHGTPPLCTAR